MKRAKPKAIIAFLALSLLFVLAACAPQQATETSDGEAISNGQPGVAYNDTNDEASSEEASLPAWTTASDCESCHTAEVESGESSAYVYSLHIANPCTTCHTDTGGQLAAAHDAYATAKQPTKLKQTSIEISVCESCHSVGDLKGLTASTTVLTDANGTVVNPHELPSHKDHTGIDCSSCHKMHKSDPADDTATAVCSSCHHQDVYECGTCHEA
jgi:cytochrome c553